jgi:hypothetical protein
MSISTRTEKIRFAVDNVRYKAENLRYNWKDLLYADLAARGTRRFPRAAYWVALTVGVRNIRDHEEVPAVPLVDVLNRQLLKVKGLGFDAQRADCTR